jgi:uncharacterized protein
LQKKLTIQLPYQFMQQPQEIKYLLALELGTTQEAITGYTILKKSLDARQKNIFYQLQLQVFINEPFLPQAPITYAFNTVTTNAKQVCIIGAGPAGYFAALQCLQQGLKPIIIERGKPVKERRRDLAALNKQGILNTESNYCFGEGGAGTYSDGKLYTRSSKRGNVQKIYELFVQFGADPNILVEAHPHIGTNKLPKIIEEIRNTIISHGGIIHFNEKLVDFVIKNNIITEAITHTGLRVPAQSFVLATGHSSRDVYELLHKKNILIEAKPFALGVRVEHPQSLINELRYKQHAKTELPPAAYSWVKQVQGQGVFSFCMCPGGIIAPASTQHNSLVVNGWSPSKRNNPFANSGIVVTVNEHHWKKFLSAGPLAAMLWQQEIEENAYNAGGGNYRAPAAALDSFVSNKTSQALPACSYIPGLTISNLQNVLPSTITQCLQQGFAMVEKNMPGYITNQAVVVATESRTSAPVRIPRVRERMHHPQITNLYPCAEGAGYAGGIVSAALDGMLVIEAMEK